MKFFSKKKKMKKQPTVTVRVEPPGYSAHEFEMPASHLRSPHFAWLMPKADVEHGVKGVVVSIACQLDDFLTAMVNTDIRAPFKPSRPPVGAEATPFDEPSLPRRCTLGCFLPRAH